VEPLVAASVLLLALMVMRPAGMDAYWGAGLAAVFALFHGIAHTAESSADANLVAQFAGFMFSTASLHLLGVLAGWSLRHRLGMLRIATAPIALAGAWMLVSRIG
jgi:urease accessory protein